MMERAAGTIYVLTTIASSRTATVNANPNSCSIELLDSIIAPNAPAIIKAKVVIMPSQLSWR